MNADTLNNMILGFSVILGVLLLYVLSLAVRIRNAKKTRKNLPGN